MRDLRAKRSIGGECWQVCRLVEAVLVGKREGGEEGSSGSAVSGKAARKRTHAEHPDRLPGRRESTCR